MFVYKMVASTINCRPTINTIAFILGYTLVSNIFIHTIIYTYGITNVLKI